MKQTSLDVYSSKNGRVGEWGEWKIGSWPLADEQTELDQYLQLEHIARLAKARARHLADDETAALRRHELPTTRNRWTLTRLGTKSFRVLLNPSQPGRLVSAPRRTRHYWQAKGNEVSSNR